MLGKGDWMHDSIDDAARNGDQDYLQRFIDHDLKDEALVRFAKTRSDDARIDAWSMGHRPG